MKIRIEIISDTSSFLNFIIDTEKLPYGYNCTIPTVINFTGINVEEIGPEEREEMEHK